MRQQANQSRPEELAVEVDNDSKLSSDKPSSGKSSSGKSSPDIARRALVIGGIGAVGVVAAACSSRNSTTTASTSAAAANTPPNAPSGGNRTGGVVVTKVADIPVGGAALAKAAGTTWLLAQPTAGEVVCHSGICTHQGCPLTEIDGDVGVCNCHQSRFNANDGAVVQGPAVEPLAAQSVTVVGKDVILG